MIKISCFYLKVDCALVYLHSQYYEDNSLSLYVKHIFLKFHYLESVYFLMIISVFFFVTFVIKIYGGVFLFSGRLCVFLKTCQLLNDHWRTNGIFSDLKTHFLQMTAKSHSHRKVRFQKPQNRLWNYIIR